MALLGDASSLSALSKLGNKTSEDQNTESTNVVSIVKAKPGKKLSSVGRSKSDSMIEESIAKPEFHIPKKQNGKSKHFNMTAEHVEEMAKTQNSNQQIEK